MAFENAEFVRLGHLGLVIYGDQRFLSIEIIVGGEFLKIYVEFGYFLF